MTDITLKKTPLFDNHVALKARMVPFAGYQMPVQYTGVIEETKNVRSHAGIFDVSHMGQFVVRGETALEELNKILTNNLSKLKIGQAQYNLLCKNNGGCLDDLIVYNQAPDRVYICVNASNIDKDFEWMKNNLSGNVELTNESEQTALIALQGPKAETILSKISDGSTLKSMNYYWGSDLKVGEANCYVSRTGYTGEDGFEIYAPADAASTIWDTLLEVGQEDKILPIGLGARDTLRLEMGYPLYGHELEESLTPVSAGLNWVIKLKKQTPFIGQQALASEKANGPQKVLRAFVVQDRRQARQGFPILNENGEKIGMVTSGAFSPHLNAPIALGLINSDALSTEQPFVEIRGARIPIEASTLPFVPSQTKK